MASNHNWVEFTFIIIVNLNNKFRSLGQQQQQQRQRQKEWDECERDQPKLKYIQGRAGKKSHRLDMMRPEREK